MPIGTLIHRQSTDQPLRCEDISRMLSQYRALQEIEPAASRAPMVAGNRSTLEPVMHLRQNLEEIYRTIHLQTGPRSHAQLWAMREIYKVTGPVSQYRDGTDPTPRAPSVFSYLSYSLHVATAVIASALMLPSDSRAPGMFNPRLPQSNPSLDLPPQARALYRVPHPGDELGIPVSIAQKVKRD